MIVHGGLCGAPRLQPQWRFCPSCGAPIDGRQVILDGHSMVLGSESFPVLISASSTDGKSFVFRARGDSARVDQVTADRGFVSTLWRGCYDDGLQNDPLSLFPAWIKQASGLLIVVL